MEFEWLPVEIMINLVHQIKKIEKNVVTSLRNDLDY